MAIFLPNIIDCLCGNLVTLDVEYLRAPHRSTAPCTTFNLEPSSLPTQHTTDLIVRKAAWLFSRENKMLIVNLPSLVAALLLATSVTAKTVSILGWIRPIRFHSKKLTKVIDISGLASFSTWVPW